MEGENSDGSTGVPVLVATWENLAFLFFISSSYSLGAALSEEMEAVGVLNCFAVLLIGLGGRMGMAAAPRA